MDTILRKKDGEEHARGGTPNNYYRGSNKLRIMCNVIIFGLHCCVGVTVGISIVTIASNAQALSFS